MVHASFETTNDLACIRKTFCLAFRYRLFLREMLTCCVCVYVLYYCVCVCVCQGVAEQGATV